MYQTDHYALHGICLRLTNALPSDTVEAMVLARWVSRRGDIFGKSPPIVPAGRFKPGVGPESWRALSVYLAERLNRAPEPSDPALDRLQVIAAHLGLECEEVTILSFLALKHRKGPIHDFATMLKQEIGLSDEAVIAWCCNLDEASVWHALGPNGPLIDLGLVQSDSSMSIMRDEAYALSGLLQALLLPPKRGNSPKRIS